MKLQSKGAIQHFFARAENLFSRCSDSRDSLADRGLLQRPLLQNLTLTNNHLIDASSLTTPT